MEATNISEGRGTPRPFQIYGAPWMNMDELYERLSGQRKRKDFALRKRSFVPAMGKYRGELCFGVEFAPLSVKADFIPEALSLIRTVKQLYPEQFELRGFEGENHMRALTGSQKAEEYLKENPGTIAVLSGGKGSGENISEAQAMYDCLVEAGIEEERLIKEDKSTSTVENLEFSAALIGKGGRIGIISQNFHIYRALKLAEHQGYQDVYGIAASSEPIYQPHFMVREAFAIMKEKLTGNIEWFGHVRQI